MDLQNSRFGKIAVFTALLVAAKCPNAGAITHTFIPPGGGSGVIMMQTSWPGVSDDPDVESFFEALGVPAIHHDGADNKALQTGDKVLLFACNTRTHKVFQCNLGIKSSARSTINQTTGFIEFHSGDAAEARQLFNGLIPNQPDGTFLWASTDGKLRIIANPDEFRLTYQ